jgi:ribosome-associated toxin RatA of RatAB toxin-antitoxin module
MGSRELRFAENSLTRTIPFDATMLYAIVSDFAEHHRRITPEYVVNSSYRIIQGGHGEGTVVQFESTTGRVPGPIQYVIEEPEPGRVLTMSYNDGVILYTWTFDPIAPGQCSLTASIRYQCREGFHGLYDRFFGPLEISGALVQLFDNLERYAETLGARVIVSRPRHSLSPGSR